MRKPILPGIRYPAMLIIGASLLACGPDPDPNQDREPTTVVTASVQAIPVRVARVTQRISDESLRFAGISRARQRASLTFQVGGVLQSRDADIGQPVVAGQVLAQLYNPQLEPSRDAARSRLEQLRADIAQAERDLTRTEQLYQRNVSPLSDLEQQRAQVDGLRAAVGNAEAALQQTQSMLAENTLRAPFAGDIEAVLREPGEFVQAGQPVIRLASRDGMEIEVRVPAHLLRDLQVGQPLSVWSSLSDNRHTGQILEMGSSSSGSNTLFPLVVSLDGEDIRAGEAFEVGIPRRLEPARVIPITAVMRSADGLTVFRFTADGPGATGTVSRIPVQISELLGDDAVLTGDNLDLQDTVVYAGLTRLASGDRVRVLP